MTINYPEPRVFLEFDGADDFAFPAYRIHPQTSHPTHYTGGVWAIDGTTETELRDFLMRDPEALYQFNEVFKRDDRGRVVLSNDGPEDAAGGWLLLKETCEADNPQIWECQIVDPMGDAGPWLPTTMADMVNLTSISADVIFAVVDRMSGEVHFGEDDGCILPGDLCGGKVGVRYAADPVFKLGAGG